MDVARPITREHDMPSIEASYSPKPIHIANLYALLVVLITFLAPVLITERFIDRFTSLLKLFKLRTCLTEIALKFTNVCLTKHFFSQVEVMPVLTVESNRIVSFAVAKRGLRHTVPVVDFGKGLGFWENTPEFRLLVIELAKTRIWIEGQFGGSGVPFLVGLIWIYTGWFRVLDRAVIEVFERWKITNRNLSFTLVQCCFVAAGFLHLSIRSVRGFEELPLIILAYVRHENMLVRFGKRFALTRILQRGTFLASHYFGAHFFIIPFPQHRAKLGWTLFRTHLDLLSLTGRRLFGLLRSCLLTALNGLLRHLLVLLIIWIQQPFDLWLTVVEVVSLFWYRSATWFFFYFFFNLFDWILFHLLIVILWALTLYLLHRHVVVLLGVVLVILGRIEVLVVRAAFCFL